MEIKSTLEKYHKRNVTDVRKDSQHKTPQPFRNKEDYESDTNENNRLTDDSRT